MLTNNGSKAHPNRTFCHLRILDNAPMAAKLNIAELIGVSPKSEFDLAEMVEKGLPTAAIARLKEEGLTFSEISAVVISPRTLKHRKARGEQLSHEETDRMVRVARIIALAEQVFGTRDKALTWLRSKDDRLKERTPLSMLHTESGGRLVENMLWQIDEGIYA
jgi:putative toxin-antitoxin system antitoxin component (TIGR02293 family)